MAKQSTRRRRSSKPVFSSDEQELIITDLLALKKTQIGDFLSRCELAKSGTKEEIRARIEEALEAGDVSLSQVVEFLDEMIPWGKQHVYLYSGPKTSIANWRKPAWFAKLLSDHRVGKYLNASLPLVLPEKMQLSSIWHDAGRVRVTAVKKRDWWERDEEHDQDGETQEGDDIQLRAFVHRVTRSVVTFEWNLVANTAMLQISQLPRGVDYADVAEEFFTLISAWLDIEKFSLIDLRAVIKKLHELEEARRRETRSHGIDYRTLQGRRFGGKSASRSDPLLGEIEIDVALRAVRKSGVGHLGNFYWLPTNGHSSGRNPLEAEVHVVIVGSKNRVNFPTPNDEQTIRHVLSRIRSHSK
jgi:hypothetical protein